MPLSRARQGPEITVLWCDSWYFPQRQLRFPPIYPFDLPSTVEKNLEVVGNA